VRDTHTYTYTYSYSHFNSAAYAHTQRQSNTKGSPDSASAPVKREIWPRRKDIIAASQFSRRGECRGAPVERVVLNALAKVTAALPPNMCLRLRRSIIIAFGEVDPP
jgi:hypothetical protein